MSAHTPEDCDRLFAKHVNAGDVGALLDLYEPGCAYVRHDGAVATGHTAIREVMERLLAMRPIIRTTVTKVVRTGDALEVVRRQADGRWKFAIDDPFARG
jgi:ketosteroid isomerase-like protein